MGANPILDAKLSKVTEGGPSFSIGHRLKRVIWNFVWLLLASWTPAPLHRWRVFVLRLFGGDVAWTAHVYPSARIWFPPNLMMKEHACLGPNVNCYCMAQITLAENAIVSQGAFLCTGSHDIDDESFQLITKPIIIGRRAWIAADAFVGPGVIIEDGAVLGARGVTFRKLNSWGVYGGNPARLIRERNRTE
jgi:putative colanic acid biosynthesis acetyltransferase WcaF